MGRRTVEVIGITGNGQAGDVVGLLPMGLDYLADNWFNTNALSTPGDITEMKELLNSDITTLITGAQQDALNQFDKMLAFDATAAPTTGSALRVPLELIGMLDVRAQYSTTRNTLSIDPDTGKQISQRRISIKQTTGNTWRLFCEVDDATQGGPGAITRKIVYSPTVAGGAEASLLNIVPFGTPERRFLRRAILTLSAGDFLSGDLRILRGSGNEELFKRPKLLNDQIAGDFGKRLPDLSTDVYELDTTETGIPEMFDTMQVSGKSDPRAVKMGPDLVVPVPFDIRPVPSAAATLVVLAETFGRL